MPALDARVRRLASDVIGCVARRMLIWALGDRCWYLDPLSIHPDAFGRIERVFRARLHEPPCPDLQALAREILNAPDRRTQQLAVGRLLAIQVNELKIARAAAYALGQALRQLAARDRRRKWHGPATGGPTDAPRRERHP